MSSTSQSSWQSGITGGRDQDAGTGTYVGAGGTPEMSTIFKSLRYLAIQNFPMKET